MRISEGFEAHQALLREQEIDADMRRVIWKACGWLAKTSAMWWQLRRHPS